MPPIGYALITSLLFSGSYVAGKYTTLDLDPLTATAFRYIVALVFLLGLLVTTRAESLRVERQHWLAIGLLGLSGIVGYHYFFFSSLRYTAVANTAIINALSPVFTGLAAVLLIRERLSALNYLGVLVAVLGVVALLTDFEPRRLLELQLNRGDLLMVLAVLCFTVYSLLVKQLIKHYSGYVLTLYATLTGVLWLLVLTPLEQLPAQWQQMSTVSLGAILYMGVAGSGLGYLTFNLSIKRLGATRTASLVYSVIPMVVAVLAWLFFNQTITLTMVLSGVLILFGLKAMLSRRAEDL